MRTCSCCKEFKINIEFSIDRTAKSGYKSMCKKCTNIKVKSIRLINPDIYREYSHTARNIDIDKYRKKAREYKMNFNGNIDKKKQYLLQSKLKQINNHQKWVEELTKLHYNKCLICGFDKHFSVIELHHPNPRSKTIKPAAIIYSKFTDEKLKILINETVPLCANCHRLVHRSNLLDDYNLLIL